MKYKNIFSGAIVTVNKITNGLVHYTRHKPIMWKFNFEGAKLSDRKMVDFIKPRDNFDKCYIKID